MVIPPADIKEHVLASIGGNKVSPSPNMSNTFCFVGISFPYLVILQSTGCADLRHQNPTMSACSDTKKGFARSVYCILRGPAQSMQSMHSISTTGTETALLHMQEVTIWAMKDVRELSPADPGLEPAARSARCAAFATAAACIAATQDKEALFSNPLKPPGKSTHPSAGGSCLPWNCSRDDYCRR